MTILRELALAEALAHRELGDRSRALAEACARGGAAETMLYCRILATIELAAAHLDGGDLATWDVFDQAKRLVEAESFGRDGRGWLARRGRRWRSPMATLSPLHWTEELVDPFWSGIEQRIRLATGDREAAGELATVPLCPASGRSRTSPSPDASPIGRPRNTATAVETAVGNSLLQTIASEGIETVELVELRIALDEWLARLRRLADADLVASGSEPAGRAADRAGTGRPAFFAQPVDDPGDRRRAVRVGEHPEVPSQGDLPKARRQLAGRSRRSVAQDDFAASIVPGSGKVAPLPRLRLDDLGLLAFVLVGRQSAGLQVGQGNEVAPQDR